MSVTIDSLDIQIRSSAGSAAKNIDDLARALSNLNASAKVTKTVHALERLNGALAGMKSHQSTMSHLSTLSKSLSSLAAIPKLTGLQSAIRELKKLPEVMASLDTAQITQFASKIKLLANGLSPLATQIDKISKGFSKLPSQVSKCVTAVKRLDSANKSAAKSAKSHGEALNGQSINLLATYEHLSNVFSMIHGIQDAMAKVLSDAMQWDGIQFQFGRAFGEDAEKVLDYAEKISDALHINKQQFMESASLYGSLLKGFGVEQKQVTTMAVGLSQLSYDIWAAYNNRYKSLEDASEAVRSAITGEIEPIRNAGIALTEASMQEYLDSIGMAHVSIEKLTEAQKSEVRYATMVNAAMNQGIIGTYAREMDTAEGAVRTLTQQLKTLGQAFGSLFIPMLKIVVPYLTAFVELVTEGVIALGAMLGINFQEITWGNATGMKQTADGANATANALGDAAKNAKKMKDYTMGFDELNVISPSSDSGSSGGAGGAGDVGGGSLGLDLDTLWDDAVFANASKQVDELKQKIKDYVEEHKVMLTVVGSVAAFLTLAKAIRGLNALFGITKTWGNLVSIFGSISTAATGLVAAFSNIKAFFQLLSGGGGLIETLSAAFPNLANAVAAVVKWFAPLGTAVQAVAGFFGLPVWVVIAGIIAAIVSVVVFLKRNWEEVTAAVKGFFNVNIAPKLEVIKEKWDEMKKALSGVLPDKVPKWFKDLGNVFEVVGGIIFGVVSGVIAGAISMFVQMIAGLVTAITGIVQVVSGVFQLIVGIFTGDGDKIREAALKIVQGVANVFGGLWNATVGAIAEFFRGVIQWFTNLWDELVGHSIVPDTINAIVDWFLSLPGKILGKLKEFCDGVKQKFVDLWSGIKSWYSSSVAPKLTLKFWLDKFKNLKEGFTQTIKNAVNIGIDMMNKFIGWLNQKLHFSWEGLTIAGKEIFAGGSVQLFTIPSIPRLENGGFLEDGLFTMNRGEIAGKFNNGKSVVANNEQIVEGIAAGVYQAVVAAMNATSGRGDQNVNVYLDGRQITAAVEKRQSERGMQLIGNQLGYAY